MKGILKIDIVYKWTMISYLSHTWSEMSMWSCAKMKDIAFSYTAVKPILYCCDFDAKA